MELSLFYCKIISQFVHLQGILKSSEKLGRKIEKNFIGHQKHLASNTFTFQFHFPQILDVPLYIHLSHFHSTVQDPFYCI